MATSSDIPAAEGSRFVLTLSCRDRIGIVAEVSRFLVAHRCNIVDSAQFGDPDNGLFFMRTSFQAEGQQTLEELERDFAPVKKAFDMTADFHTQGARLPALILVSKFGHCLNDLLYRHRIGALPLDIRAVVSNHSDFADVAAAARIPFHHLAVTPETKAVQEMRLLDIARHEKVELIVLARYMQVLSPMLCAAYSGRIINIHHSFLPSFKGARPYQQAHERGVKLIGATAHYVTSDLDEGPIIEQAVERVTHAHSIDDMVAAGRDLESVVLARAVKWHAERRTLPNGRRTVVFR
ncbi:MAG: formyltetrahydrofolate deformylase [Alphaproteobacteria bacterium]|nr:formyltetrahydrofolate deformylase [Alphaproteobacteria bacterium]